MTRPKKNAKSVNWSGYQLCAAQCMYITSFCLVCFLVYLFVYVFVLLWYLCVRICLFLGYFIFFFFVAFFFCGVYLGHTECFNVSYASQVVRYRFNFTMCILSFFVRSTRHTRKTKSNCMFFFRFRQVQILRRSADKRRRLTQYSQKTALNAAQKKTALNQWTYEEPKKRRLKTTKKKRRLTNGRTKSPKNGAYRRQKKRRLIADRA